MTDYCIITHGPCKKFSKREKYTASNRVGNKKGVSLHSLLGVGTSYDSAVGEWGGTPAKNEFGAF